MIEKSESDDTSVAIDILLSKWLYNSSFDGLITISKNYFRIRKPLIKRLYEIARKHCGRQQEWEISLSNLHKKVGTSSTLKEFKRMIVNLSKKELDSEDGIMPDYTIVFDSDRNVVIFKIKRNMVKIIEDLMGNDYFIKTATFEKINQDIFKQYNIYVDIYALKEEWINYVFKTNQIIKNPDAAFYGFCIKKAEKGKLINFQNS